MKAQFDKDIQNISILLTPEWWSCALYVRDGVANCDVMSCTAACKIIDLIFFLIIIILLYLYIIIVLVKMYL